MAGEAEQFKVSLIADYSDLNKKITQARADLAKFDQEKKERQKVRFTATLAELQSGIDKARKQLRQFKKDGDKAGEIKARIDILNAQKNITQVRGYLRELDKEVKTNTKSFFSLNGIVKDAIKAFGGLYILRQIKGLFTDMVDSVISFDSAFAGVRKTVDATEEEFAQLSQGFKDLSTQETPLPIEELLKIGEVGGQLGIAKEELIDFTKIMAELGITTNLTAEEAAKSFARIKNVFRLTNGQVDQLSSSLVDLGNNVAADEAEILNFANRLSGVGNAMGLTAQETFGIAAAFRSVGVEAESGGTAIQKALITMNDIVQKGGAELKIFAKLSGKTVDEFVQTWKTEPVEAFKDFVKILGSSGDQATQVIEGLIGNNERLKRAFLTIAGSGDLLAQTIDLANQAYVENTARTAEAEKRYQTFEVRIQALKNTLKDIAERIGKPVVEALVSFAEKLRDIIKSGKGLKEFSGWIKLVGTAIGTYLGIKVLSSVKNGLLAIVAAGQKAKVALTSLAATGGGLSALTAAINPIMTIATIALPLLINAWIDAKLRAIEFDNAIKNLKQTIEELTQPFETLKIATEGLKAQINEVIASQEELLEKFGKAESQQEQVDMINKLGDSIVGLRERLFELGESFGTSREETEEFLQSIGVTGKEARITEEQLRQIAEVLPPLFDKNFTEIEQTFNKTFTSFQKTTDSWQEAFGKTMDEMRTDLGDTAKTITETYIKMAGESGEIGSAFLVGLNEGMTREDIRAILLNSGIKNIDELIGAQLKKAAEAEDIGRVISGLVALGISEEEAKVIAQSDNLMQSIVDSINAYMGQVQASGQATGEAAGIGIAKGFAGIFPTLNKLAVQAKNIISQLSPQTAEKIDGVAGYVKNWIGSAKAQLEAANQAKQLQATLDTLQKTEIPEAADIPEFPSKRGGGGGGGKSAAEKLKDETEKTLKEAAKVAEKELNEFDKQLEDTTKKSADLSKRVKEFYSEIASSIKDAQKRQKELTQELDDFKEDETTDYIKEIAERNAELEQEEKDLQAKIEKIKAEGLENQEEADAETLKKQEELNDKLKVLKLQLAEYDENTKESTKLAKEQAIEKVEAELEELKTKEGISSETEDLLQSEEDLRTIQEERAKIAEIAARNTELTKEQIQEIFDIEKKRASLTEAEQGEFDLQQRIKEKEAEIKAEIEGQQRLIDMRKRFLEIIAGDEEQSAVENAKKKRELLNLTNEETYENEEEFNKKLAELGFEKLNEDEKLELLKLANQEKNFVIEERKLRNQQDQLLAVKNEYVERAEKVFFDSVDRQKEKIQELINKIREAQAEMNKISSAPIAGVSEGGASYQFNQNNNVYSDVDMQSAMNQFLQKVSQ